MLAILGWGFSALLGIIAWLLKARMENIERLHAIDIAQVKADAANDQKNLETWKLEYVKSSSEITGSVALLQDNYKNAIETIKSDLRDIKLKTDGIPVMDTRLRQVENMIKGDKA